MSQRALAREAGVAYKTVQLIEAGRDARWSTLGRLARALGLKGPEALLSRSSAWAPAGAAEAAESITRGGEGFWKQGLFDWVDAFRRAPAPEAVARAPGPGVSPRVLALLASTVESLCAETGLDAPWWCAGVPPLEEPWFVAGVESLKASAILESPAYFRHRNIFVLGNFLSRA